LEQIEAGLGDRVSRPLARAASPLADGDDHEVLWPVGDTRAFTIVQSAAQASVRHVADSVRCGQPDLPLVV